MAKRDPRSSKTAIKKVLAQSVEDPRQGRFAIFAEQSTDYLAQRAVEFILEGRRADMETFDKAMRDAITVLAIARARGPKAH